MSFRLRWTSEATQTFQGLQRAAEQAARGRAKPSKGGKALRQLAVDPRHPSLNTHEYESLRDPHDPGAKVFAAYAQNKTPGAYRIFWSYGPERGEITILAITPHP